MPAIGWGIALGIAWWFSTPRNADVPESWETPQDMRYLDQLQQQENTVATVQIMTTPIGGAAWSAAGKAVTMGGVRGIALRWGTRSLAAGTLHKLSSDVVVTPFQIEGAGVPSYWTDPGSNLQQWGGNVVGGAFLAGSPRPEPMDGRGCSPLRIQLAPSASIDRLARYGGAEQRQALLNRVARETQQPC